MNSCHLHVHCEKSWFDGIIKVPNMIMKAAKNGMNSVALTDHHHTMGWFELEVSAKKMNVKPIFGIELNVASYHLTALAMNEKGLENIIKLNNIGHKNSKIALKEKDLLKYKEGIYFLTGCSKGKVFTDYYKSGIKGLVNSIREHEEMFGRDFGIEITNPHLPKEVISTLRMTQDKGIPIVPTNDCHYLEAEDRRVYEYNIWLRTRGKIQTSNQERYFKTQEEMLRNFKGEWLENTMHVSNRCNVSYQEYCNQKSIRKISLPLCKIERYSDEESMRIIYQSKREFSKAKKVYNHMKTHSLKLEDMLNEEEYSTEVNIAFGLRDTIKGIKENCEYNVFMDIEKHPILKNRKTGKIFSQWTVEEAEKLKMDIVKNKGI